MKRSEPLPTMVSSALIKVFILETAVLLCVHLLDVLCCCSVYVADISDEVMKGFWRMNKQRFGCSAGGFPYELTEGDLICVFSQ